jgi:cation diffusion facilitator family transporter
MHKDEPSPWAHAHVFDEGNYAAERGTRAVMWITLVMMVVEITAGWWFNSMALLADGWHMSSHAVAIGLSAFAYSAARRYADDPRFAFGTWKIEVLGGFASAILLLGVAAIMVWESAGRLLSPQPIHYQDAIIVAVLGLIVNVVCALILGHAHEHHHHDLGHHEHADHGNHHHDLNLKSAYVHVLADAATSVLAIVALGGGLVYGWSWLDPVMGMVGAGVIAAWARNLLRETGKVLLDREMDHPVVEEIREAIEQQQPEGDTHIVDLHVWRVGKNAYACAIGIVTNDRNLTANQVRDWLSVHEEIMHATIEIHLIR